MWCRVLVSMAVSLAAGLRVGNGAERQPQIDELIARISQRTANTSGAITVGDSNLAKQIHVFGTEAAPRLIALLDGENASVRKFAGYVLRDLPGLSDSHLDALIAAYERGNVWVLPPIARVGTPRAVEYLVGEFTRIRLEHTQIIEALKVAGEKAAYALAEIFGAPEPVADDLLEAIRYAYYEMAPHTGVARPRLIESATNPTLPVGNRRAAVRALGALRLPAAPEVPRLQALANREPEHFAEAVDLAIIDIGSPEAATSLAAQLLRTPSDRLLLRVAQLREKGRVASLIVAELLNHEDWDVRVAAARTLGYIGATEAEGALRNALSDAGDWRVAYSAAQSLGRLKARTAAADLEAVAKRHWHGAVRSSAAKAVRMIQTVETYESRFPAASFGADFFDHWFAPSGIAAVDPATLRFRPDPNSLTETERQGLAFTGIAGPNSVPHSGLRLGPHGYLLGTDRGEWGGELVFREAAGATHMLLYANVHSIVRMPHGIAAATGLDLGDFGHGFLYAVDFEPGQKPTARRWKSLPGAPRRMGMLENGNLFVSCVGGDIVVTPNGEMLAADAKNTAPR